MKQGNITQIEAMTKKELGARCRRDAMKAPAPCAGSTAPPCGRSVSGQGLELWQGAVCQAACPTLVARLARACLIAWPALWTGLLRGPRVAILAVMLPLRTLWLSIGGGRVTSAHPASFRTFTLFPRSVLGGLGTQRSLA